MKTTTSNLIEYKFLLLPKGSSHIPSPIIETVGSYKSQQFQALYMYIIHTHNGCGADKLGWRVCGSGESGMGRRGCGKREV
jgi:hypothetical protein